MIMALSHSAAALKLEPITNDVSSNLVRRCVVLSWCQHAACSMQEITSIKLSIARSVDHSVGPHHTGARFKLVSIPSAAIVSQIRQSSKI